MYAIILNHKTLERSLAFHLCSKIASTEITSTQYFEIFAQIFEENEFIQKAIRMDLIAIKERDPACPGYVHALLYMKGFHGVTC